MKKSIILIALVFVAFTSVNAQDDQAEMEGFRMYADVQLFSEIKKEGAYFHLYLGIDENNKLKDSKMALCTDLVRAKSIEEQSKPDYLLSNEVLVFNVARVDKRDHIKKVDPSHPRICYLITGGTKVLRSSISSFDDRDQKKAVQKEKNKSPNFIQVPSF